MRETLPDWSGTQVRHVVYLPTDYRRGQRYPVIVEFAGNGGYRSKWGDVSTGLPEGSKLGYGMSAGRGFIWVCAPFLSGDGKHVATRWWGEAPSWDVEPTVEYCRKLVPWICEQYGGDPNAIVLAGFSRGAIACNFVGLHDDEIAGLWCAFVPYSHYDGTWPWDYPGSDRPSAKKRLQRLRGRPQLICHEHMPDGSGLEATRRWIESTNIQGQFTFLETGFRNHADAWVLRPGPARTALRRWLAKVVRK